MRFEVRQRNTEKGMTFSIWDKELNCWHLYGYGYLAGTYHEMVKSCESLNRLQAIKDKFK